VHRSSLQIMFLQEQRTRQLARSRLIKRRHSIGSRNKQHNQNSACRPGPAPIRTLSCLIERRRTDKYRNNVKAIRLPDRSVPPPLIRPAGHWSHSAGPTSFSTILVSCPAPGKVACPDETLDLPWLPRFRTGHVFQSPFPTSAIFQCPDPSLAPLTLSRGGCSPGTQLRPQLHATIPSGVAEVMKIVCVDRVTLQLRHWSRAAPKNSSTR